MEILVPAHENNVKVHTDIGKSQILILITLPKNRAYIQVLYRETKGSIERKKGQEV